MTDEQVEISKANAIAAFTHAVRLAKNQLQKDLLELKSQMTPDQVEMQKTMTDALVSDLFVAVSDVFKEEGNG